MIKHILLLILLLNLYGIEGVEYIHPKGDTIHKDDSIRVEAFLDLSGDDIFYGSRMAAGLLAWKEWVNNKGGVCLSRSTTSSAECPEGTEKKQVSLRIIDWAKGDSKETRATKMYNKGVEICKNALAAIADKTPNSANKALIPHFVIAPYGDELVQQLRDGMLNGSAESYNGGFEAYKNYGCNVTVILASAEEETLKSDLQKFMYNINNAQPDAISASGFEFFSQRNTAITYAVLGSSTGEGYYFGERVQKAFENAKSDNQLSKIKQVMKRCSNVATDPYASSCGSDNDCAGEDNKCVFARHQGTVDFPARYVEELRKWVAVLKEVDPDVVVISDVDGLPTIMELAQQYQWTPSGVLVTTPAGFKYYTELASAHWTYLTPYSQFNPDTLGNDQGKYMGTNLDFKTLMKEKLKEYLYDALTTAPSETSMDIEYSAMGAACGVTVQRAIELAAQGADDEKYLPDDQFNLQSTTRMHEILTGFGECGYASSGSGTASWTGQFCQDDTACGAGVTCLYWESFYGTIHFGSESHMNEQGELILMQVYENVSDDGNITLSSRIIGPSTNDVCNEKGDCDSARDWNCQCESEFPAPFSWVPNPIDMQLKIGSSGFYVLLVLVILLAIGYITLIALIQSNTGHVVVAELPGLVYTLQGYAILAGFSFLLYTFDPEKYSCLGRTALFGITSSLSLVTSCLAAQLTLLRAKKLYVPVDVMNKRMALFGVLIVIYYVAGGFIFLKDSKEQIIEDVPRRVFITCEVSLYSYMAGALEITLVGIALKFVISLIRDREESSARVLAVMMIIQSLFVVIISWIMDLIDSPSLGVITTIAILKSFGLAISVIPLYVYLILEKRARVTKVTDLNTDVKFLESIISKPISRAYFREFLKQSQLEHFVDCYVHICLFKQEQPGNDKVDYEDWIYETFISFGAFSVNVPPNVLEDIQKRLKKADNCVFDKAQKSLIVNLQTNNYFKLYLLSSYAEHARKLTDLMTTVKSRDIRIREVMKDLTHELIQKKKKKKVKDNKKDKTSAANSQATNGGAPNAPGIPTNAVAPAPAK